MHCPIAILGWFLAVLLAGGCNRGARVEGERESVYQAEATFLVRVVNHSRLDATIYVVHDGIRDRLGSVTAATSVSFRVRGRTLTSGAFVLVADPIGGMRTTSSETLHTGQGAEFTWTLESDFSRGSVMVRE